MYGFRNLASSNLLVDLGDSDLPSLETLVVEQSLFLKDFGVVNTPNLKVLRAGFCNINQTQGLKAGNLVEA